jgi:predicted acyl esterase
MRGKFRSSYSKPEAFAPGKIERVTFGMDDVLHTFKKGHRIMVHIQSTWFPLVDRNPQKFVDIYSASASDFTKATQRVYRSAQEASRIELPVLP